jgi:hypothetical protein
MRLPARITFAGAIGEEIKRQRQTRVHAKIQPKARSAQPKHMSPRIPWKADLRLSGAGRAAEREE